MTHSSFFNLDAWQVARRLVRSVYDFTRHFPSEERYVMTAQMRRATHSIHSNIAEGRGRLSNGEWQQFLGQARGSLMEVESFVIVACDLGYCTNEQSDALSGEVSRVAQLINGVLRSTRKGFPAKKYKT